MSSPREPAPLRRAIEAHGRDAVSFQGLEPGLATWLDPDGGAIAYADTDGAWVAAGGPNVPCARRADAAARFVADARAAGQRASFFAVDDERAAPWPGFDRVLLGEQPVFAPTRWADDLGQHRRLREQLRRARAKGVRVRPVAPRDLTDGSPLRRRLDDLTRAWLASRPMAPMGFVVTLAPFEHADAHRYFVAEHDGRAIAFLSLVPIPARDGWLLEDLVRGPEAPNGTSEALIDAAMRALATDGVGFATTGLVPLVGAVPAWMRAIGRLGRALYDFDGLRRFKQRLHPPAWEPVWLCYPEGESAAVHLVDALRAFAGGSLIGFGLRTVADRPGAMAWSLGAPLVPWTALLAALTVTGHAGLLGFGAASLAAWTLYDALLAVGLLRASRRPTPRLLAALAGAATVDAALSLLHLADVGRGAGLAVLLRALATLAPLAGATGLWWAHHRARRDATPPPHEPLRPRLAAARYNAQAASSRTRSTSTE